MTAPRVPRGAVAASLARATRSGGCRRQSSDDHHQMYILFAACTLKRIPEVQSPINGCCNSAACSSFLTLVATNNWRSSAGLTTK